MKRQAVHFSDDILLSEIIDMARTHGMHVRITCGLIVVDRVPNIVRDAPENLIVLSERVKK